MLLSFQMGQVMVRFAWLLAVVSPVIAGLDAGSTRKPGLVGLRDAIRAQWPRDSHHDVIATNQGGARDGTAKRDPLRCFEVHHPVLTLDGPAVDERPLVTVSPRLYGNEASPCRVVLMDHSFANSYGSPFVAQYQPPACAFNRVVLRLDVASEGRQFDRLAIMYLGDIELWRTSTAEPKPDPGIVWTIRKDSTPYLALWKNPQTLIFDLGNLVNDKYTGAFNTTLTATFFQSDVLGPNGVSADAILPISARRGVDDQGSSFTYPETPAEAVLTLPRNTNRGILTVSATGQAGEEFWWANVPEKDKDFFDLESGPLPGLSSYREVQVRIDDQIAGLTLPFPVVFTGGIAPPLHRPIVGLQAFDLREHEIDVSPFLGVLCDGNEHKFSFDVYGVDDSNDTAELVPVPMHWVLTGKLFLWLDDEGAQTRGSAPDVKLQDLEYEASSITEGESIHIQQSVKHSVHVVASVTTQQGTGKRAWHQDLSMESSGTLSDDGDTQYVDGLYEHTDFSKLEDDIVFSSNGSFPINSNSTYREPDKDYDFSLKAVFSSGMTLTSSGQHIFPNGVEAYAHDPKESWPESTIRTLRSSNAFFYSLNQGNSSGGYGDAEQFYELSAARPLYRRFVSVANETTVRDREFGLEESGNHNTGKDVHDSGPARHSKSEISSAGPDITNEQQLHV